MFIKNLVNYAIVPIMVLAISCEEKAKETETPKAVETEAEAEQAEESEEEAYKDPPLEWLDEKNNEHIRQAAILASETFVFNPFPFPTIGWSYFSLSSFDQLIDENDKHGYGKDFKRLFRQARNQKNLGVWLQSFVKRVASQIPREKYVANGWDAMVRQLLFAYDDLAARPNAFSEVYAVMEGKQVASVELYYQIPFVHEHNYMLLKPFIIKRGNLEIHEKIGNVNRWAVVWAYSFWGRRYHENPNNIKTIASTLRMLRDEIFACKDKSKNSDCLSYQGQTYNVVKIGEKIWMAENLNYNKEGSVCFRNNPANCKVYGKLYDWATAKTVCPSGWHLPSNAEWEQLFRNAGGNDAAGERLKAAYGWADAANGLDTYGFSALPGMDGPSDEFDETSQEGKWWSSSEANSDVANYWNMSYYSNGVRSSESDKKDLYSVRCVRD